MQVPNRAFFMHMHTCTAMYALSSGIKVCAEKCLRSAQMTRVDIVKAVNAQISSKTTLFVKYVQKRFVMNMFLTSFGKHSFSSCMSYDSTNEIIDKANSQLITVQVLMKSEKQ